MTEKQKADLAALETLPDAQIDTSDIPAVVNWPDAQRGLFYRPGNSSAHTPSHSTTSKRSVTGKPGGRASPRHG